jgi:hypothetical protein
MKSSKKIICMDAYLSERTYKLTELPFVGDSDY